MTTTPIALIPSGQSLDMVTAVGGLLDAAIEGAMLAAGNGLDVAAKITLGVDRTERDAIARLHAATRRIARHPIVVLPEDQPDDHEVDATLQQVRHEHGGITFGIAGQHAADMARTLLAAFIPAIEEMQAPNYLTFDAFDQTTGKRYNLIVVKPDGKSPHELRTEAEAERDRLRTLLAEHGIDPDGHR